MSNVRALCILVVPYTIMHMDNVMTLLTYESVSASGWRIASLSAQSLAPGPERPK